MTATVRIPGLVIDDGLTVGNNLQAIGHLLLGQAAPAGGVSVTLTSNSPDLLISDSETAAGSTILTLSFAPGQTSKTYYLQGRASAGMATYTASAPGYASRTATTTLAPSGIIISGVFGIGLPMPITMGGGVKALTIATGILDPNTNGFTMEQPLAGGQSLTLALNNSNPAAATVPSSVTFPGGASSYSLPVTPVAAGSTLVSLPAPMPGFTLPRAGTSQSVVVSN